MNLSILKNYLKITSRNLLRNKLFSFISIMGFTAGLTVFILIMLFVHNETSYDSFHKNKSRLFRAAISLPDITYGNFPGQLARMMKETMPQIEHSANYLDKKTEIKVDGELSKETVTFAGEDFFKMFSFKTFSGNPLAFGKNPLAMFVTRSFAERHFGKKNPLGKTVTVKIEEQFSDFIIDGILEDPPENTVLKFKVLLPFVNAEKFRIIKFSNEDIHPGEYLPTFFVMLKNESDKSLVEAAFKKMVKPLLQKEVTYRPQLKLCPMEKVHLDTEVSPYFSAIIPVNPLSVIVLSIIGVVILIIVSINYVNLTIAQSSHRFKEIGIRKVSGAERYELVFQFIAESFLIILISLLISIILAASLLPLINQMTDRNLSFTGGFGSIAVGILLLPIVLSILSGAYPALVMSGLNPVKILKGSQKLSGSKGLAKIFVTTQFVLAIVLISGAVIINYQYNFIMKTDLGYNKDNMVIIRTNEIFGRRINEDLLWVFKNQVTGIPGVRSAAISDMMLGDGDRVLSAWRFDYEDKIIPAYRINADDSLLAALNLKLLEGRSFSSAYPSDSLNSIIVNEEFVKEAGLKNPIGKTVKSYRGRGQSYVQIIGVVKSFHFRSLRMKLFPAALSRANRKSWNECVYVKISPLNRQTTISRIKKTWERLIPGQVFDYVFLDQKLNDLYKDENRWRNLITSASVVSILFASMGLFGLVFYAAEKRTKEIGIRKVLGASTLSIIRSLVNEFIVLIAIAILIGCSVSYYLANKWLNNFAYHINLNTWIFILAALMVTLIVISTLLIIAFRVASANSVDNLRYE